MNEEYDVIVLGTGLTVSAELRAVAEDLGGACRPARGRRGLGAARTPLPRSAPDPGLRLSGSPRGWYFVVFSAAFGGESGKGVGLGARGSFRGVWACGRTGPGGRDWVGRLSL